MSLCFEIGKQTTKDGQCKRLPNCAQTQRRKLENGASYANWQIGNFTNGNLANGQTGKPFFFYVNNDLWQCNDQNRRACGEQHAHRYITQHTRWTLR
ncbi:hypothetical protein POVCU2_0003830 [Plasmodium ovale curtisi]|uniref:Uncharacterized protein n=1 Tax=Plasmodium ovale curtisi TaxID=864141 RepID=A0A1A8VNH6_PLAOA|nr:hypothetical protein POVCU2_0003830 [Plasmodium ovale curtisi]SBS80850.1 hypothetical protein POVCU1_003310 [Plasmodium ovale curtisi]